MNETKVKYNSQKLKDIALRYNLSFKDIETLNKKNNFILAKDRKTNKLELMYFEDENYIKKHLRHLYLVKEVIYMKSNNTTKNILIEERKDQYKGIYQIDVKFEDNQIVN